MSMNKWLKEHHISQAEVAALLNVSVSTVSRIVNGQIPISMKRAACLHATYGMPYDIMSPPS